MPMFSFTFYVPTGFSLVIAVLIIVYAIKSIL